MSNQIILTGIIDKEGFVITDDGKKFRIPIRGFKDGYPEVLVDATSVNGSSTFTRQSVEPYVGMKCRFVTNNGLNGFNFIIIKE